MKNTRGGPVEIVKRVKMLEQEMELIKFQELTLIFAASLMTLFLINMFFGMVWK